MTPTELSGWMARMEFSRPEAATALGISPRTIEAYLRKRNPVPVPRPVELLAEALERSIHSMGGHNGTDK